MKEKRLPKSAKEQCRRCIHWRMNLCNYMLDQGQLTGVPKRRERDGDLCLSRSTDKKLLQRITRVSGWRGEQWD